MEKQIEEGIAGGFDPFPIDRGLAARGDLPIGIEGAEMIEPDDIVKLRVTEDPLLQEGKALLLHLLPVIDGVAPALAGRGEIIRWYPGDEGRFQGNFVEEEVIFIGIDIAGIVADIERNVADDLDAFGIRIGVEGVPLTVGDHLEVNLEFDGFPLLAGKFPPFLQIEAIAFWPIAPRGVIDTVEMGEDRIIVDPRVLLDEFIEAMGVDLNVLLKGLPQ